ncbi:DUF2059 domain-containing protein [Sphingomonas sp.]|jgi:hypothetical protein|uniref:DUF2059 domain-containing protein n=1 Tax=Sphingomonas sp. TaxID=28214 RepID=UPI0026134330|nr:DUF2059 domain-containing protein [Sphingomonas sp.]MDF2496134.1 hypothetical protein [Sphingomonas sp.]
MSSVALVLALVAAQAPASHGVAPAAAPETTPATASTAPVDPARLAVARAVIDQVMPPASRAQMIEAMVAPVMTSISRTVMNTPALADTIGKDAKVRDAITRFMERQNARTMDNLRGELPAMAEAMSRAYARRFDERQLKEISAFFATPTGKVYLEQAPMVMSDPDVMAWQSRLMAKSMSTVQDDVAALTAELTAAREDEQ